MTSRFSNTAGYKENQAEWLPIYAPTEQTDSGTVEAQTNRHSTNGAPENIPEITYYLYTLFSQQETRTAFCASFDASKRVLG